MAKALPEKFAAAEDLLHEMAAAEVGFNDFGDEYYLTGLRVLLNSIDEDLKLDEVHRERVFGMVLGALIGRLYSQKGWRENPDCLKTEIHRPLIITGVVRTGTTPLQKVLAVDPQFQGLEFWIASNPMVRPARKSWPRHPLYQRAVAGLEALHQVNPNMNAIHEMVAGEADECLNMMVQDFVSNMFSSCLVVPSYDKWWMQQDETPSYHRYLNNLKLIGFREQNKRWLLKNPGHILCIKQLLEIFPDACIVQTHRDPVKTVPSVCDLIMMSRKFYVGSLANPEDEGPREVKLWSLGARRAMEARRQHPERFHDVQHRDFVKDPIGVVQDIYRRFDLTLEPAVEEQMKLWLKRHEESKPGYHRYTPEQFGITEEDIRREFKDYIEYYYPTS